MICYHGGEIYDKNVRLDYSVSLNPLGCPESAGAAIAESVSACERYPDIRYAALRRKISVYENERYGDGTDRINEDMIVPGSGASELIMAVARAYAGAKVLLGLPAFAGYERAFESAGCVVEYFRTDDAFTERIRDDAPDLVVIGSPANPTGQIIKPEDAEGIVKACMDSDSFLLADEAFMGFVLSRKNATFVRFFGSGLHAVVIRSFTKLYSCPGLRAGYAVCSDSETADKISSHLPEWNISAPAEMAMIALCGEGDHADKSTAYVADERSRLVSKMTEMGMDVYPSDANYIFFRSREDLYERLLDKGILIRRCDDHKGIEGTGNYRIGIKTREEDDELLAALEESVCLKI